MRRTSWPWCRRPACSGLRNHCRGWRRRRETRVAWPASCPRTSTTVPRSHPVIKETLDLRGSGFESRSTAANERKLRPNLARVLSADDEAGFRTRVRFFFEQKSSVGQLFSRIFFDLGLSNFLSAAEFDVRVHVHGFPERRLGGKNWSCREYHEICCFQNLHLVTFYYTNKCSPIDGCVLIFLSTWQNLLFILTG